MNDVFISYQSSDRAVAQRFADSFEARGWSVWWDREIPVGKSFDQVIEQELTTARCVVVLWSKESVASRWVRAETSAAASRDCLVPVLIEDAVIPLEFRQLQTAMLVGWAGDTEDPEYGRLVEAVATYLDGTHGAVAPSGPSPQPAARPRAQAPTRARRVPLWAVAAVVAGLSVAAFIALRSPALRETPDGGPPATPKANDTAAAVGPVVTLQKQDANAAQHTATEEAAANAPPAAADAPAAGAARGFAIKIGDRIEEGVPGPGAGSFDTANEEDVYTFTAAPGASVYFRVLALDRGLQGSLRLVDERGAVVFDNCLGCTEPGLQRLAAGGRYTLSVRSSGSVFGTYRLRLFPVPPPDRFEIAVGDTLSDGRPKPGAGSIETPGAQDIYTFRAAPRQRVYFRKLEQSDGTGQLSWRLTDDDEQALFDTCFGCSDPGVVVLRKGGEYRLTVGASANPGTGTYRVQLTDVPPPSTFALTLPARVSRGSPGPGAGFVEVPGAEDVYTFTAAAGQSVSFELVQHDASVNGSAWRLLDDNEAEIFNTCLGCSSPGVRQLSLGGRYRLIVGNVRDPSIGAYAFEIAAR